MRILCRSDVDSWAFGRRAKCYATYPPAAHEVRVANNAEPRTREQWDGVLLLDAQASAAEYRDAAICRMISSHAWLYDERTSDMRTRGVNRNRCLSRLPSLLAGCSSVAVYNRAQMETVNRVWGGRVVLAPYTVDTAVFVNPGARQHERLRVGWCQQAGGGLNSFKGLTDVLIPVVARVGSRVEWSVLTPDAHTALGTEDLVRWYQSLDVFLCTSSGEGGPHGPFEAAACGCAVISTDVGQVSDWAALHEVGLLLPTYSTPSEAESVAVRMSDKLLHLAERHDELRLAGTSLWQSIQAYYNAAVECPRQLEEMFRG